MNLHLQFHMAIMVLFQLSKRHKLFSCTYILISIEKKKRNSIGEGSGAVVAHLLSPIYFIMITLHSLRNILYCS